LQKEQEIKNSDQIFDMLKNLDVYRETRGWKRPIHVSKALLAKNYLKLLPNVEVIGITGSVGKTLTQNAIYAVLSQKYKIVVGDENLDPTFRIPQTILKTKPWDQKIILEYGVEHPGDMDYYLSIVKPKIAVVTAITPTHIKYFTNVEGVFKEKLKLVKALGKNDYAVLNSDDPYCQKMAKLTKARIKWFGKSATNAVKISAFQQNLQGSKFRLSYKGQKEPVSWKIIGEHQLLSAYAALTVGIIEGMTINQIAKGLSTTQVPVHRLNVISVGKMSILDDTYNSSPAAAKEAANTLIALGQHKTKIAVFGDMKDLGGLSKEAHQNLGKTIAASNINILVTIGKEADTIAKAAKNFSFKGKIIIAKGVRGINDSICKLKMDDSVILIKGSRHAHLERLVFALQGKPAAINCYHCGVLA